MLHKLEKYFLCSTIDTLQKINQSHKKHNTRTKIIHRTVNNILKHVKELSLFALSDEISCIDSFILKVNFQYALFTCRNKLAKLHA